MGIRIDGTQDLVSASDGSLTIEGQSVNTSGMMTATGGLKIGTAATIHSTGQFNIGVAATIFASGNATFAGIVTASEFSVGTAATIFSNGNITAGIVTASAADLQTGPLNVGTAATISANGNATFAGIVTATSFIGDGSGLSGVSAVGGATGVDFNDGVKARWGTGNDLEIYHTGGDYSYIKDNSGRAYLRSDRVYIQNNAGDENLIYAENGDGAYLYFNNSTKLATTNTGVSVTGSVTPSGGIYLGGAGGGNYLDDYEKGTWTPAINSGYTVSMHSNNQGQYIKVGKLVYYQGYVRVDTMSGSSSETYALIKGLPFAHNGPAGIESNIVIGWTYGLVGDVYYGYIDDNTTQMVLLDHPSSGSRNHLGPSQVWQNGARLSVSGCYEVD